MGEAAGVAVSTTPVGAMAAAGARQAWVRSLVEAMGASMTVRSSSTRSTAGLEQGGAQVVGVLEPVAGIGSRQRRITLLEAGRDGGAQL